MTEFLPDPYAYPHEYFQVLIPEPLPSEVHPENLSETGPAPKIATYQKIKYVEKNGAVSLMWIHIKTK